MEFQDKLRVLREEKGYTQSYIADKIGITKSTYCGYETGKRSPDVRKLKMIANAIGVSVDELLETDVLMNKNDYIDRIKTALDQLNEEGQERVLEYAEDMVAAGRFKKSNQSEMVDQQA